MLEYGIAAFLDPRQQNLGRFRFIWEVPPGCPVLKDVVGEWETKDDFLADVIEQTKENAKLCMTKHDHTEVENK